MNQIKQANLEDQIEVLYFKDNYDYSIGYKRNELLKISCGKYVCFIDDDDDIHNNYISMIYEKLLKNPDCVSLIGLATFDGKYPHKFIHSIQYATWFQKNKIFYRPPNHLNPIKREIAIQFSFPEKNFAEDIDWSMTLQKSGLLQHEEIITEPYYFYIWKSKK